MGGRNFFDRAIKGLVLLVALVSLSHAYAADYQRYDLSLLTTDPIGDKSYILIESEQALSFAQALEADAKNQFSQGQQQVLTFGVGVKPVWVKLALHNDELETKQKRLIIDAPWLDDIQVFILNQGSTQLQQYQTGDNHIFSSRSMSTRTFHFQALFPPGNSDLYIRVATPDPMVIPIYLMDESDANRQAVTMQYGYGFGYGVLVALLAYNLMLFFGLREIRYLLYVVYLGTFTVANFTYTGHGFYWLWPESMAWQQWSIPLLIVLFGITGLSFALHFLDTRDYARRLYNSINIFVFVSALVFLGAFFIDARAIAFLWSFIFLTIYLVLMLVLGVKGLNNDQPSARYFLSAMVAGLSGVAISMFATWGYLPFNNWSFNAAQIGTVIEAILLAFALSYRFRRVEEQKLKAEEMALIDPLTQLNNRRSFYQKASNLWNIAKRYDRSLSVIMFDLDNFKAINDQFGHRGGDIVLRETGKLLSGQKRKSDIVARWGGEEFIFLLAESGIDDATLFAERLRESINTNVVLVDNKEIHYTASFGVAEKVTDELSIDTLIEKADKALYQAKNSGKNRVIRSKSNVIDIESKLLTVNKTGF